MIIILNLYIRGFPRSIKITINEAKIKNNQTIITSNNTNKTAWNIMNKNWKTGSDEKEL